MAKKAKKAKAKRGSQERETLSRGDHEDRGDVNDFRGYNPDPELQPETAASREEAFDFFRSMGWLPSELHDKAMAHHHAMAQEEVFLTNSADGEEEGPQRVSEQIRRVSDYPQRVRLHI